MAYQFNWGQANDKRPSVLSQAQEPTKPAVTSEIGKKTCGSPHGPTSSSSKSQTGAGASNSLKSKLQYDRPIGPLSDEKCESFCSGKFVSAHCQAIKDGATISKRRGICSLLQHRGYHSTPVGSFKSLLDTKNLPRHN